MNATHLTITTLTPVHIGSGTELSHNYDFLLFPKEVAIMDEEKIFDIIGAEQLHQWIETIEKKEDLLTWLQKRKLDLKAEDISKRVVEIFRKSPTAQNKIKEQLHGTTMQMPMLPGSSLKGAIRTVITTTLIKQEPKPKFVQDQQNLGFRDKRGKFVFKDSKIMAHYFGRKDQPNFRGEYPYSANKDFLKLLRISDFTFATTGVYFCNIINQFRNGWGIKESESSFWECIPAEQTATGRIQIPEDLLKNIKNRNYISENLELLELQKLFQLINEHTLHLLGTELDYWNDEDNPLAIGDYLDHLERLEEIIKDCKENECVLRVGAGSGWDFMTGAWAKEQDMLDDKAWDELLQKLRFRYYPDNVPYPKTRKLVEGGMPLGFVKIKLNHS